MALVTIYNNRDGTMNITVKDANGDTVVMATGDFMRVKLLGGGETPVLDILGGTATSNGSEFPADSNPFTLTLNRADVALLGPGIWTLEVSYYDLSLTNWYFASSVSLEIRPAAGGAIV